MQGKSHQSRAEDEAYAYHTECSPENQPSTRQLELGHEINSSEFDIGDVFILHSELGCVGHGFHKEDGGDISRWTVAGDGNKDG